MCYLGTFSVNCQTPPRAPPRTPPMTPPRTPPRTPPVSEPRYVGDIRTPHLATPRRAKRAIALTRRVIGQHKKTIKSLQQSRNRLRARIKSMKDLLTELKRKNLISESAFDNLMVKFTLQRY
ncbi:PREDICTED: leiomodin-2-like [Vollenhovia emeryi]|uniref:leiomodin-2-like n=1 Tax=Vollenhovia emeryi TaxID=411798 RepID=UPI0005F36F02|nr:PREDICTED: leiomodin-2-like [Vollenhovia emeryi]